MNDRLYCGDGWEFCSYSQAEQWYDFYESRWRSMQAAGKHNDCQAYRRRKQKPTIVELQVIPKENDYLANLYWTNGKVDKDLTFYDGYRMSLVRPEIVDAVCDILADFQNETDRTARSVAGTFENGIFEPRA